MFIDYEDPSGGKYPAFNSLTGGTMMHGDCGEYPTRAGAEQTAIGLAIQLVGVEYADREDVYDKIRESWKGKSYANLHDISSKL